MALAVAVFAVYGLVGDRQERVPDQITVSAPKVEQLAAVFAKTWQRAPTSEELKGLVDDYVKEEIYVREALALRLNEDDTVIRRRLRQKMEFLSAAEAEFATPSDSELDSYLKANPHHFELESKVAFQQIFLSPYKHGDKLAKDAAALLDVLATDASVEPNTLGDPTLLPYELPLTEMTTVAQTFGTELTQALDAATLQEWSGPVSSTYGFHLIKVKAREPGRLPPLGEVRDAVLREWVNAKRLSDEKQRLDALLTRYVVTVEMPGGPGVSP